MNEISARILKGGPYDSDNLQRDLEEHRDQVYDAISGTLLALRPEAFADRRRHDLLELVKWLAGVYQQYPLCGTSLGHTLGRISLCVALRHVLSFPLPRDVLTSYVALLRSIPLAEWIRYLDTDLDLHIFDRIRGKGEMTVLDAYKELDRASPRKLAANDTTALDEILRDKPSRLRVYATLCDKLCGYLGQFPRCSKTYQPCLYEKTSNFCDAFSNHVLSAETPPLALEILLECLEPALMLVNESSSESEAHIRRKCEYLASSIRRRCELQGSEPLDAAARRRSPSPVRRGDRGHKHNDAPALRHLSLPYRRPEPIEVFDFRRPARISASGLQALQSDSGRSVPESASTAHSSTGEQGIERVTAYDSATVADALRRGVTVPVAEVEGIWLHVDPIPDRIVPAQESGILIEEVLSSVAPGTLRVSTRDITWQVGAEGLIHVRNRSVRRRRSLLDEMREKAEEAQRESLKRRLATKAAHKDRGVSHVASSDRAVSEEFHLRCSEVRFFTAGRVTIGSGAFHYIALYARQAYKLFPFFDDEITDVIDMFTDLIGVRPFRFQKFVSHVLAEQNSRARARILRQLESRRDWISNTQELTDVLKKLLDAKTSPLLYDMEKLFHSCRLNPEALTETVAALKAAWEETAADAVRQRVLAVAQRLVDKTILNSPHSKHLAEELTRWFSDIESRLDPYRGKSALNKLTELRRKVAGIKRQGLSTITEYLEATSIDRNEEFQMFKEMYDVDDDDWISMA